MAKKKSSMDKALDKIGKAITDVVSEAVSSSSSAENSTQDENPQPQAETSKNSKFTVKTQFRCIWLKFYGEQVENYSEELHNDREYLEQSLEDVKAVVGDKYWLDSYVHDGDFNKDDFWKPSIEKPHAHLLLWLKSEDKSLKTRVGTLLKELEKAHIRFRKEEDTTLLEQSTKFPNMRKQEHIKAVVYHTHETCAAKEDDLKVQYPREGRITNLPQDMLDEFYRIYEQKYNISKSRDFKLLIEDYSRQAYEIGREGLDFNDWFFNNVPVEHFKHKSMLIDWYERGTEEFLSSEQSMLNVRCSIFINGTPNCGKTYNSKAALNALGVKAYPIEAGGTGKTDDLKPSHKGIVVSDTSIKNLLAMADNTYTKIYRRNNSNPLWTGNYFIITYNGTFDEYLADFYSNVINNEEQIKAAKSRFFECFIDHANHLVFQSVSTRGNEETIKTRLAMAYAFKKAYDQSSDTYIPIQTNVYKLAQELYPDMFKATFNNPFAQIGEPF